MMSDLKSIKSFWLVFTIIVLLFSAVFISLRLYRSKDSLSSENASADNSESGKSENYPKIVNYPASEVEIGSEFIFIPKVVVPTEFKGEYSLSLEQSPEWMEITENIIRGIPSVEGTESFVIRISTPEGYMDNEYNVIVNQPLSDE